MGALVARAGAGLCLMHMRGTPRDMQSLAVYADLHGEVLAELSAALERAAAAGVAPERVVLDPGLGFAKTFDHNLLLLRRQRELSQLGRPLLVGPSRKAFLGRLTGRPAPERAIGTAAAAALSANAGAFMLRVHDVAQVREALAVADAVRSSGR
jgi:dihydropteroate synthase